MSLVGFTTDRSWFSLSFLYRSSSPFLEVVLRKPQELQLWNKQLTKQLVPGSLHHPLSLISSEAEKNGTYWIPHTLYRSTAFFSSIMLIKIQLRKLTLSDPWISFFESGRYETDSLKLWLALMPLTCQNPGLSSQALKNWKALLLPKTPRIPMSLWHMLQRTQVRCWKEHLHRKTRTGSRCEEVT